MPKVDVSSLRVVRNKVEVPTVCSGSMNAGTRHARDCGADLTNADALVVWEYADQARYGRLAPYDLGEHDPDGGIALDDEIARGGDSFIPAIAVYCAQCGTALAEGSLVIESD